MVKFNNKRKNAEMVEKMQIEGVSEDELVRFFIDKYEDLAGSEILSRAFVAERNKERKLARYWSEIYLRLAEYETTKPQPNFVTAKTIFADQK